MTIIDKLNTLLQTKTLLKQALIAKGVNISDTDSFESYVDKIGSISGGSVPSGYIVQDYIKSTSDGYINLYYYPNNNTKVVTSIMHSGTYLATNASVIMGATDGNNIFRFACSSSSASPSRGFAVQIGTVGIAFGKALTANVKYNITASISDGLIVDGTKYGDYTSTTFTSSQPFYLFNSSNFSNKGFIGSIYATKIYEGDTLLYDLIPVQQKDSGVYGFYNKVNGCFYPPNTPAYFTGVVAEGLGGDEGGSILPGGRG